MTSTSGSVAKTAAMATDRFSPADKSVGRPMDQVRHADAFQGGGHGGVDARRRPVGIQRTEGDIFADGGHKQLVVRILKHQAERAAGRLKGVGREGDVAHADVPGAGGVKTVEVQQQGGLARPVGTDQSDGFPRLDVEGNSVQGLGAVRVGVRKVGHLDVGRVHGVTHTRNAPSASARFTLRAMTKKAIQHITNKMSLPVRRGGAADRM
jgi:hypothetical protein